MNYDFLLHQGLIEFSILTIMIMIYFQFFDLPENKAILYLLGSYSLLKSIFDIIHWKFHYKKNE